VNTGVGVGVGSGITLSIGLVNQLAGLHPFFVTAEMRGTEMATMTNPANFQKAVDESEF
jgi:hypothetical protein